MISMLVIGGIFNILGDGFIEYMLLMYRSLQLILHLPIFQIIVPANVLIFIEAAITVVQFDI